ncbi:putative protein T-ENOL [Balaenoptera acutorostrata]|uniref:Uncharacterized protein n=1 Tax=Balaenoptera acutorostrata TaxID=9767 RepID=A0ABM3S7T6_BALAC|nr:putative protein T-ENOL [Balaenoptera acutorostrata]
MASSATRNVEKKGSGQSQATTSAASLGGGPKVSHSEEFLTQISTELTDEALFVAAYRMNPMPIKEKQTQDQGTQISKHAPCGMWDLTSQTKDQTGTPCSGNAES